MFRDNRYLLAGSFLLLIVLALSGCGLIPSGDPLDGTAWQLESYEGREPVEGIQVTAQFEEGSIGGSSSCNSYGGSYEVSGDQISVSEVASTMMACLEPEGVMEQEQRFLALLMTAETFSISGDTLELVSADESRLVFAPLSE